MKTSRFALVFGAALVGAAPGWSASKSTSDLFSPPRRQKSVDLAEGLTRKPEAQPLPANLPQPFNPTDFEQPDPEEQKANATARGNATGPKNSTGPVQPAGPVGDRELLESVAARIQPTGSVVVRGKPLLIVGKSRLEVGNEFTVDSGGRDYVLELIAIDRTTFTLRYRGEEITRPIKPTK